MVSEIGVYSLVCGVGLKEGIKKDEDRIIRIE